MKKRSSHKRGVSILYMVIGALLLPYLIPNTSTAAYEAALLSVEDYDDSDACGADNLVCSTQFRNRFGDGLEDMNYDVVAYQGEHDVHGNDFNDSSADESQTGRYYIKHRLDYSPQTSAIVGEKYLISDAEEVLEEMGAYRDELDIHVRDLVAATDTKDPRLQPATREPVLVAKKVIIYRKILGNRVLGDKIVLTYTPDGEFRKIQGNWTPVDYQKSELTPRLVQNESEFVERALERLVENRIPPFRNSSIELGTIFQKRRNNDKDGYGFTLHLVGYAAYKTVNGAGSAGPIQAMMFEI